MRMSPVFALVVAAGCTADVEGPIVHPSPPADSARFHLGTRRGGGWPCCGIAEVAGADFDADGAFDVAVLHGHYHYSSSSKNLDVETSFGLDPNAWATTFFINGGAYVQDGAPTATGPGLMAAADLDGQGGPDLVGIDGMRLRWLRGAGKRMPLAAADLATLDVTPTRLLAGDVLGDHLSDVVVEYLDPSKSLRTRVYPAAGPGALTGPRGDIAGGLGVLALLADLNGDRHADLAAIEGTMAVARGFRDPDGFVDPKSARFDDEGHGHATAMAAADMDRDGRADLIVGEAIDVGLGGGRVIVLKGNESGGFARGIATPVRTAPLRLVTADFDGDGRMDVAGLLDEPPFDFTVLLGDGSGGFSAGLTFPGAIAEALLAADVDRDGIPDLITVERGGANRPDSINWWRGAR